MLTRTDIVDEKMLNDLRVIANFDCDNWNCSCCPFSDVNGNCISMAVGNMVERYDNGEEVIY